LIPTLEKNKISSFVQYVTACKNHVSLEIKNIELEMNLALKNHVSLEIKNIELEMNLALE
jgi:hypothetical protein